MTYVDGLDFNDVSDCKGLLCAQNSCCILDSPLLSVSAILLENDLSSSKCATGRKDGRREEINWRGCGGGGGGGLGGGGAAG